MQSPVRRAGVFFLMIASSFQLSFTSYAAPRQTPDVSESQEKIQSNLLPTQMTWVSHHYQVAVEVEGLPYISSLERRRESLKSFKQIQANPPQTARFALTVLAKHYDYEVEQSGKLFLLRKRCSIKEDLPFLSLDELAAICSDMKRAASGVDSKFGGVLFTQDKEVARALRSLTPQQLKQMQSDSGVAVSQLSAVQQRQLYRIALSTSVERWAVTGFEETIHNLAAAREPMSVFSFPAWSGVVDFSRPRSDTKSPSSGNLKASLQEPAPSSLATDAQTVEEIQNDALLDAEAESFIPLSQFVQVLPQGQKAFDAKAEPGASERRIAVFGADRVSPREAVVGLVKLLGLRLTQGGTPSSYVIKRPGVSMSRDYATACVEIRNAMPPAWLTSMHIKEQDTLNKQFDSYRLRLRQAEQLGNEKMLDAVQAEARRFLETHRAPKNDDNTPRGRYPVAVQQIARYVLPRLKDKKQVTVADLPPRQQSAFATCIASALFDGVMPILSGDEPRLLQEFGDMFLRGGSAFNKDIGVKTYEIELGYNRDGSFKTQMFIAGGGELVSE